jgi:hypothetical protein
MKFFSYDGKYFKILILYTMHLRLKDMTLMDVQNNNIGNSGRALKSENHVPRCDSLEESMPMA